MKKILKVVIVVLLMMIAGVILIFVALGGPQSLAQRRKYERLAKTCDREQLLSVAIQLIERATNAVTYRHNSDDSASIGNLPPIFVTMQPKSVLIGPHLMRMEYHGGFDHFGFVVQEEETQWVLASYTEHGRGEMLTRPIARDGAGHTGQGNEAK